MCLCSFYEMDVRGERRRVSESEAELQAEVERIWMTWNIFVVIKEQIDVILLF
jgi:hypothetical protein